MEGKSYEVKYCPEQRENVSIEVEREANGAVRRRCLRNSCSCKDCSVCQTEGVPLWR